MKRLSQGHTCALRYDNRGHGHWRLDDRGEQVFTRIFDTRVPPQGQWFAEGWSFCVVKWLHYGDPRHPENMQRPKQYAAQPATEQLHLLATSTLTVYNTHGFAIIIDNDAEGMIVASALRTTLS